MYNNVINHDIEVALVFFDEILPGRALVIECISKRFVPYIKHNVKKLYGVPDRTISNTLYYGGRMLIVRGLDSEPVEYDDLVDHYLFVGTREGEESDTISLSVIPDIVEVLILMRVLPSEILQVLESEGYGEVCCRTCLEVISNLGSE